MRVRFIPQILVYLFVLVPSTVTHVGGASDDDLDADMHSSKRDGTT